MNYSFTSITFFRLLVCFLAFHSLSAQQRNASYIFGHSLVNHNADRSTQNRSNIPDWLHALSEQAGYDYAVDGQFGFLPNQALPPVYQWGFINAPSVRTNENNTDFGSWDYDNVIVTLANFIQSTPPNQAAFCAEPYWEDCRQDPNALTSVDAVLRVLDYALAQEPDVQFYIYENWPEFYGTFPPESPQQEAEEFGAYYDNARGAWHDWWIELQDLVVAARPEANVKMIPVGPILADLFDENGMLSSVSATTLYEDAAPHGYPVTYFLTALIHYSALYGEKPPADFQFPDDSLAAPIRIPDIVRENYQTIVDFIWNRLQAYTFDNGDSRVFTSDQLLSVDSVTVPSFSARVKAYPNPGNGLVTVAIPNDLQLPIEFTISNILGQTLQHTFVTDHQSVHINLDNKGTFFLKIDDGQYSDVLKLVVH